MNGKAENTVPEPAATREEQLRARGRKSVERLIATLEARGYRNDLEEGDIDLIAAALAHREDEQRQPGGPGAAAPPPAWPQP